LPTVLFSLKEKAHHFFGKAAGSQVLIPNISQSGQNLTAPVTSATAPSR
jgi:hypothetical protein